MVEKNSPRAGLELGTARSAGQRLKPTELTGLLPWPYNLHLSSS